MPMRNMPRDPNDYAVVCKPERFGDDTVVFRCAMRLDDASAARSELAGEFLVMNVELSVSDTDSFGDMRRSALQLYGTALRIAADAVAAGGRQAS